MIYSNIKIRSQEKEMENGLIINVIELGQHGRGRKMLKIFSDREITIEKGYNKFSIIKTENGEYKIVEKDDKTIFFLISTEGNKKIERSPGEIMVPIKYKNRIEILATGKGIDSYTEYNIEYNPEKFFWKSYLLKVKKNTIFKIVYAGLFGKTDYICIENDNVHINPKMTIKEMYEKFGFLDLITEYKILESI